MKRPTEAPGELDLHRLVDDQLDQQQRRQLLERLQDHPQQRQTVNDCQAINLELHDLYDDVLSEPIPDRLLLLTRPRQSRRGWLAAAIVAWFMIGGGAGWFARDWFSPMPVSFTTTMLNEAILAHLVYTPEVRHPVEVNAGQEQHLSAWLSKRLHTDIRIPQLNTLGFDLLGGRLLPADNGPAAQFMYQDSSGQRLTLFVRSKNGAQQETTFRFAEDGQIRAFYWIDGNLGYALIGAVNKNELMNAAHAIYEQLSF